MIEIHYMVLACLSSVIIGLGVIIWATRDVLAQEERTSGKLANTCTELRATVRDLHFDRECAGYEVTELEEELRVSLDHIEIAKLERDELRDDRDEVAKDFDTLDELTTLVAQGYEDKLATAERLLEFARFRSGMWAHLLDDANDRHADELELVKLERDEARDERDTYAEQLPLFVRPVSDVAPNTAA